jgi:hypothetical protein
MGLELLNKARLTTIETEPPATAETQPAPIAA